MLDLDAPSSERAPRTGWLVMGWSAAHLVWVAGYIVAMGMGAVEEFCDASALPMHDGGPSNESAAATWVKGLIVVAVVGVAAMMVATIAGNAARGTALWMNAFVGLDGIVAVVVLYGLQLDQGRFCSGVGLGVGGGLLVLLVSVAVYSVRLWSAPQPPGRDAKPWGRLVD